MPTAPLGDWGGGPPLADACRGDDGGLINPSLFPCRASDLQPSRIETAADDLTTLGDSIAWEMTGISSEWHGMRPWYETPEQEQMLALMEAPADDARTIQSSFATAGRLLLDYADALVGIQRDLADLEYRATQFRNRVKDGLLVPASESERPTLQQLGVELFTDHAVMVSIPWSQDTEAAAENARLLAELDALVHRLTVAADEVENGINPLVTQGTPVVDTEPIPEGALTDPSLPMPWGYPREEDRNTLESIGNGGYRIWGGLLDMLALVGVDARTGQSGLGFAAQSWAGAANVLGSAAVTLLYPPDKLDQVPQLWGEWLQERHATAAMLGLTVGYDPTAADPWHQWESDPIATGMDSIFNVATMFAPGGAVAGGIKLGARAARVVRIAGEVADFALVGGSYLLAGGVRVVSRLSHCTGRVDDIVIDGVRVNVAELIGGTTAVSDEFFGTTTAEQPSPGSSSGDGGGPEDGAGGDGGTGSGGDGTEGGDGSGGNQPFVNAERLSDRHPGVVSSVRPHYPNLDWAHLYNSGDARLPGNHPPISPADTYDPVVNDHGWRAEQRPSWRGSIKYQMQVTGIEPNAQGWLPEYWRTTPGGAEISYDGMTERNGIEVYMETKRGWDDLAFKPSDPDARLKLRLFIEQAQQQQQALPTDAVLEWHISDPHAAAAIHEAFADPSNGLEDVVVLYTPEA